MSKTKRWIEKQQEEGNYTLFSNFGAEELAQQQQQEAEEYTPNLNHQKKQSDEEE